MGCLKIRDSKSPPFIIFNRMIISKINNKISEGNEILKPKPGINFSRFKDNGVKNSVKKYNFSNSKRP
jgi:hypothetical protein